MSKLLRLALHEEAPPRFQPLLASASPHHRPAPPHTPTSFMDAFPMSKYPSWCVPTRLTFKIQAMPYFILKTASNTSCPFPPQPGRTPTPPWAASTPTSLWCPPVCGPHHTVLGNCFAYHPGPGALWGLAARTVSPESNTVPGPRWRRSGSAG